MPRTPPTCLAKPPTQASARALPCMSPLTTSPTQVGPVEYMRNFPHD